MSPQHRPPASAENEFITCLRLGDVDACVTLVHRHAAGLLATCRRLLPHADALRAVHEAFVATLAQLTCADDACLHACLRRNAVRSALALMSPAAPSDLTAWLPTFTADGHRAGSDGDWSRLTADPAGGRDLAASVRDLVRRLPPPARAAFVLHEVEHETPMQLAGLLGVSLEAARQHLHLARTALRGAIDRELAGPTCR